MRKIVKPAHPQARIRDLDRGGFLPPGGVEVTWNSYFQQLLNRGDITAADPAPAASEPAPAAAAPVPTASPAPKPAAPAQFEKPRPLDQI